jgi:uncharacterized protein
MRDGFRVFDADAHVIYPQDLWAHYLDKEFVDRVKRVPPMPGLDAPGLERYNSTTVDGRWTRHPTVLYRTAQPKINWKNTYLNWGQMTVSRAENDVVGTCADDLLTNGFTGDRVAKALSLDGIDVSVVYGPEFDLWFEGITPEMQAAMVRAYNRWGAEMREASGDRVHVAGPVPLLDVTRALDEIAYAYEHLGTRCFWARPNLFNDRTLGDGSYDPVWELLQDLDVPFATHEFMGLRGTSFGSERFRSYVEWHSVVHPFEAMGASVSMIVHGVFERFPRLRVAYMEAGCGWLPSWLHRIDEHLELASLEFPELTMSATGYFRRNCWISTECEDPFVADVVRWLGDDHIVFESDFPHPDSKFPEATRYFLELEGLSDESKRKILWDNPVDFYRFPADYLPR